MAQKEEEIKLTLRLNKKLKLKLTKIKKNRKIRYESDVMRMLIEEYEIKK